MFIATPSPEPPKPRRGEMYAPRKHIPPLRGLGLCAGRGYTTRGLDCYVCFGE